MPAHSGPATSVPMFLNCPMVFGNDVIKGADWIIDLGPEAGDGGGNIVYAGVPAGLKSVTENYTGKFL